MAKKFLIIRFSSIGDIIQCMDVVNGIMNHFPDAEIHWIARKDMASFLAMDRRIARIWAFDRKTGLKGLLHMAGQLKKEHFDYIYDAHSNIRSHILRTKLIPCLGKRPHFALRPKERMKRFLLFRLGINTFPQPFKGRISYRKPLEKWGICDFRSDYTDWHFPEEYSGKFDGLFSPATITLIPSANWPKKRWPVSRWQELIRLLPQYNFLILAGPADTFCEEIKNTAPERVNNLAGKTSLLESCYLVLHSRVVISADTGFLHAADLFCRKALALMGPTAFGFPTGNTVETLEISLNCRPCTKDGSGKCKQAIYQKCMTDITAQQVAAKVKQLCPVSNQQ